MFDTLLKKKRKLKNSFFYKYEIDISGIYLEIATSPDLKYILNYITNNFTKFELKEMTHLKYPNSYRMSNINQFVLTLIIKELSTIFNNLHINKIKAKKGRKIECLEFTSDAEKHIHNKRQPQLTNIVKLHQYTNREKTPKWLDEKIYKQSQELHNEDAKLKQDREVFQRQLEEKWEE